MKWLARRGALGLVFLAGLLDVALADSGSEDRGAPPASETAVVDLRMGRIAERVRLVLDLSAAPDFRWQASADARDVDLWISGARWQVSPDNGLLAGTPVQKLLHTQQGESRELRVRLALRESQRVEVFSLKPDAGRGHRLVVDLYPQQPDPAGAMSASGIATASVPPLADNAQANEGRSNSVEPPAASSDTTPVSDSARDNAPQGSRPPGGTRRLPQGEPADWLRNVRTSGYAELTSAYTVSDPSRWSILRARVEPAVTGSLGASLRFKLAGRAQGDAAFDLEDDYYPSAVRDDQRSRFTIREAYIDADAGDWQLRLGRQHVVWGEMVGLFLADVVSARDMREFYLQEFDAMRIPQWGVRAERFAGDSHVELLWIPYPSYDEIGEPGSDFYPFPVPAGVPVREDQPSRNLGNSHWGIKGSHLVNGWDISGFYYQSQDVSPNLYSTPTGLALRNDSLKQVGASFSKDFYSWVLRGEAVHTQGRRFFAGEPALAGDFSPLDSDALDYVVGVTIPRGDWRVDLQFYGRRLFQHQPQMLGDANEIGYTAMVNYGFGQRLEWEVLYLSGLNRTDWSLQPRVVYNLAPEWRLQFGADLFGGDPTGLFGQFDQSDRVYLELRRWF